MICQADDGVSDEKGPRANARGPFVERSSSPGEQRRLGVGQELPDVTQELRAELAVDDPVVDRQAQGGDLTHFDLALVHPRLLAYEAERQDRRLAGRQD